MKLGRRHYGRYLAVAVGGLLAGSSISCKPESEPAPSGGGSNPPPKAAPSNPVAADMHICAGKNSCKGKGGCKTGDKGCAGKNSCKGKGGCATDGSKKS